MRGPLTRGALKIPMNRYEVFPYRSPQGIRGLLTACREGAKAKLPLPLAGARRS